MFMFQFLGSVCACLAAIVLFGGAIYLTCHTSIFVIRCIKALIDGSPMPRYQKKKKGQER